jgi:hypothetical protein
MRPGRTSIGKIPAPSPAAGKYSVSGPAIYIMKVVYVDEEGNEVDQPPPCWYVMEDTSPPVVRKVCASLDKAQAYAQSLHNQRNPS